MARMKDDAAEGLHRELVEAFGDDWSIDDFPPDDLPAAARPPVGPAPQGWVDLPAAVARTDTAFVHIDVGGELTVRAQYYTRADEGVVEQPVQLSLTASTLHKLQKRAEAAGVSIDDLVSEWVTAEADADATVSRDELLALLARRQPRSA